MLGLSLRADELKGSGAIYYILEDAI